MIRRQKEKKIEAYVPKYLAVNHSLEIGDLVSLVGSVYGPASGVVIDLLGVDVRILYTEADGTTRRIRRRGENLVLVRKQNSQ